MSGDGTVREPTRSVDDWLADAFAEWAAESLSIARETFSATASNMMDAGP
jgi:hypothetical protein